VPCWLAAGPLWACSCPWLGAFLDVAPLAPLVVRAEVLQHSLGAGQPTLVLRAKEALAGGLLDSGLVVAMSDGMHCRPDAALFPPGSEWILALNGPGASRSVSPEEIEQIRRDGHGVMEILSATPGPVREGCPSIGRLRFRVDVFGRR
jgi:hypothetical protein